MQNQSMNGQYKYFVEGKVTVSETCTDRRSKALTTTRGYARRDSDSLTKGCDVERMTLHNLKTELINLREKVSGLIQRVNQEIGYGSRLESRKKAREAAGKKFMGIRGTRQSWAEKQKLQAQSSKGHPTQSWLKSLDTLTLKLGHPLTLQNSHWSAGDLSPAQKPPTKERKSSWCLVSWPTEWQHRRQKLTIPCF